jgi:hypothetical protein
MGIAEAVLFTFETLITNFHQPFAAAMTNLITSSSRCIIFHSLQIKRASPSMKSIAALLFSSFIRSNKKKGPQCETKCHVFPGLLILLSWMPRSLPGTTKYMRCDLSRLCGSYNQDGERKVGRDWSVVWKRNSSGRVSSVVFRARGYFSCNNSAMVIL